MVLSIVNVLVAVATLFRVSFAVIWIEYVPSAIVELVKFQFPYVPVLVPKIELLITIVSAFVSDAVPRIDIVETERFWLAVGLVIDNVGAVVSLVRFIIIDVELVAVRFTAVEFGSYPAKVVFIVCGVWKVLTVAFCKNSVRVCLAIVPSEAVNLLAT